MSQMSNRTVGILPSGQKKTKRDRTGHFGVTHGVTRYTDGVTRFIKAFSLL